MNKQTLKNKFEILKTFASMLENSSLVEIHRQNDIILCFCKDNSEPWWNYALINRIISNEELNYIESFFKKKSRYTSIYFSDDEANKPIPDFLKGNGYELAAKDSWLFWNKESPADQKDIIEIKNNSDFEKWIETFIKSYPKDDPKNPYGEQIQFAEVLKRAWFNKKTENDKHYLAFKNKQPVATAMLSNFNKMGYISSVGSIPSVRGEGYGKKISLHCVKESIKAGNKHHFLATEKGHYPYEFYQRVGFEPEFIAFLYSKNDHDRKQGGKQKT